MGHTLSSYGGGLGMTLGLGIGGLAAVATGMADHLATLVGLGLAGGLSAGAVAGLYADLAATGVHWGWRVFAVTLLTSLAIGGLSGLLTSWLFGKGLAVGMLAGGSAGGVFGFLMGLIIFLAARADRLEFRTRSRESRH